jgi:hypothetical protein
VASLVARNANEAVVAPRWDLAESVFGGSQESVGRFCIGAFGRKLASVAVKTFSHLILFKNVINVVLSEQFAKIKLK